MIGKEFGVSGVLWAGAESARRGKGSRRSRGGGRGQWDSIMRLASCEKDVRQYLSDSDDPLNDLTREGIYNLYVYK